jgi:ribose transport system substrate-binding protein
VKKFKWNKNNKSKNKIYFEIVIFVLLIAIAWASYGMLNVGKKVKTHAVSVIVNNSNSDKWAAMREGLEQAAVDNHITLNFVSTEDIKDMEEEETLINRELENGADGLIIQMVSSYDVSDMISDISSKTAVVLIETDVAPEEVYTTVMPDNAAIGKAIGKAIIKDMGGDVKNKKIGVLCDNQSQLSMIQRLKGLQNSLKRSGAKIAWTLETTSENLSSKLMKQQKQESADILVTLDNNETEAAADFLQNSTIEKQKCLLYGEGCSEKAVYYLDKGVIQTLVVPNEFNMGYLSMAAIANQLQFKDPKADNTQIDFLVINKDNLYDADNQKILFPIVQ